MNIPALLRYVLQVGHPTAAECVSLIVGAILDYSLPIGRPQVIADGKPEEIYMLAAEYNHFRLSYRIARAVPGTNQPISGADAVIYAGLGDDKLARMTEPCHHTISTKETLFFRDECSINRCCRRSSWLALLGILTGQAELLHAVLSNYGIESNSTEQHLKNWRKSLRTILHCQF